MFVYLEEIGVAERRAETKDKVSLRMLRNWLHDGTVDDDEMFGRGLDVASLARVARVEEQRRPLEAHPVAAPSAFPGQLHLVFLAQQPLFDAQEPVPTAKDTEIIITTSHSLFPLPASTIIKSSSSISPSQYKSRWRQVPVNSTIDD